MKNELLKEALYIINTHVKTIKVDVELKVIDLKNKIQAELEKPEPVFNGWYCPHCETGVDPTAVTCSEHHEACGTYIGDTEPPKPDKHKPEPVAWMIHATNVITTNKNRIQGIKNITPLYTSPPQQKPLTQEDIIKMAINNGVLLYPHELMSFVRAIERAHGIGE